MGINADNALFSRTKQRVLGALFGSPHRSFYATELIAATRGGSGAVQRELARLEAAGLVRSARIGRRKHYQANPSSAAFGPLVRLLRALAGGAPATPRVAERRAAYDSRAATVLERLGLSRDALASFCRENGIARLSFFGSVTRHDFSRDSDVDVLAEFDPDQAPGLFGLAKIREGLTQLFGGRAADLASPAVLRNPVRRQSIQRDLTIAYAS